MWPEPQILFYFTLGEDFKKTITTILVFNLHNNVKKCYDDTFTIWLGGSK